ncbi:nucleotide exchange factor GrpE [Nonomuraea sp. NPDC048901]|uniref:nucleotide exchange factor GrpE n=1 Tax=Nonomuraea sp. NPDC048901 TaxID=3155627 RepID=UPI0033D140F0
MADALSDADSAESPASENKPPTLEMVMEALAALRQAFDSKIRYDNGRERLIQTMSEELEQHRNNVHQSLLRPVLIDLISLYDDLTQVLGSADAQPGATDRLEFVRDTVEQILTRNGVQKFTVEGSAVDRSRQRVVSTVDTPDPDLRRKVAQRLRPGFAWDETVLRPEWVSAYRHVETPLIEHTGEGAAE